MCHGHRWVIQIHGTTVQLLRRRRRSRGVILLNQFKLFHLRVTLNWLLLPGRFGGLGRLVPCKLSLKHRCCAGRELRRALVGKSVNRLQLGTFLAALKNERSYDLWPFLFSPLLRW